ncbi:MAG TPA: DinB family protein [Terriglobales bacterium]
MSESTRLADQIRRAFEGDAWHGDSVLEILSDVKAATAAARPIKNAHSIWELVLHMAAWDDAVLRRSGGEVVNLSDRENFPPVVDTSEKAWRNALEHLKKTHAALVKVAAEFPDSRLQQQVQGKSAPYYTFFYMFAGIVQHELYHAGQIVMLKKAAKR